MSFQSEFDSEMRKILEDAAKESQRLIRNLPDRTFSERIRISQFRRNKGAIDKVIKEFWSNAGGVIQSRLIGASDISVGMSDEIARALGQAARSSRKLAGSQRLIDSFESAAFRGVENVQSRLMNDIHLSPRVYRNRALTIGQVDSAVNRGIVLNKSAKEIAKSVYGLISSRTPGGASFAAMRLGRTELNNAFHITQTRSYAEQPWITGVKWSLSGSHPRPDACDDYANGDHDGLGRGVFKKGDVPGKPHPQCLCYITAITIDRDDFVDDLISGKFDAYIRTH